MMNHCSKDKTSKHGRAYLVFIHVFFGLLIAVSLSLLFGFLVMLLWNAVLPDLLGVKSMTYLQGIGLLLLCRILVGDLGLGKGGHHRRSPEQGWQEYEKRWKETGEKSLHESSKDQLK